jgi:hypothetical protein
MGPAAVTSGLRLLRATIRLYLPHLSVWVTFIGWASYDHSERIRKRRYAVRAPSLPIAAHRIAIGMVHGWLAKILAAGGTETAPRRGFSLRGMPR